VLNVISNNRVINTGIKDSPWPVKPRQYVSENVWIKQPDGSYIHAYKDCDKYNDNNLINLGKHNPRRLVRSSGIGYMIIKRNGSNKSCKLSFVQQNDAKGKVPRKLMERVIPRSLKFIIDAREKFSRDDEIDKTSRFELMNIMRTSETETYSEEEKILVDSVKSRMTKVHSDAFRPLKSPDFRTKMSIAHVEGENNAYMKCEVIIDASVEEATAYVGERASRSNAFCPLGIFEFHDF